MFDNELDIKKAKIVSLSILVSLILTAGAASIVEAEHDTSNTAPFLTNVSAADSGESAVQLPPGASDDWWAAVLEDIRVSEYNINWQEQTDLPEIKAAYQAPNRAHNLRTYFTPDGVKVIPRTSTDWNWGLSLRGYGFEGDVKPVTDAELSISENRIEYQREGLTEWYVNDEEGLEQGFTLNASPEPEESGSWLVLIMELSGDLNANLNSAADTVEFTTAGDVGVLRYSELYVFDATGRELPARFSLTGSEISITVDTANAKYPITIDPLASSPSWSAEGNQQSARFGYSVATAGDVNGDGYSDVIVGAYIYDNGQTDEGRAFVYHGSSSGLSSSADWTAESNQASVFWLVGSHGR